MNARSTRILHEARVLWAPFCVVFGLGLLMLFQHPAHHSYVFFHEVLTEWLGPIGFFIGIPLLATLPLSSEFQYGTLALRLTQPVERARIWNEKLFVSAVALLPVGLIYVLAWRDMDPMLWLVVPMWAPAVLASAMLATLIVRTTVGSIILNTGIQFTVFVWGAALYRKYGPHNSSTAFTVTGAFILLAYLVLMVWLSRRTFLRYQLTGGPLGEDLLSTSGAGIFPWSSTRTHYPPVGAVSNLIRKEVRLLQPVWLLTVFSALCWIYVGLSHSTPRVLRHPSHTAEILFGLTVLLSSMIPIISGSLSLGEERTSGTHAWHLTLPISPSRQWLIKLLVVVFASCVGAVLIPIAVLFSAGVLVKAPFMLFDPAAVPALFIAAIVLSLGSFWGASVMSGTVRAVLLFFTALVAFLVVAGAGDWLGNGLMNALLSKFDPFASFNLTSRIAHNAITQIALRGTETELSLFTVGLFLPVLLVAVAQSYRLFRKQLRDDIRPAVRSILSLAALTLLISLSAAAFNTFVMEAWHSVETFTRETHQALLKVPAVATVDEQHPLQLTLDDLANTSSLSPDSRRWLEKATITVREDRPHPGNMLLQGPALARADETHSWRSAVIESPNGIRCTEFFNVRPHPSALVFGDCNLFTAIH